MDLSDLPESLLFVRGSLARIPDVYLGKVFDELLCGVLEDKPLKESAVKGWFPKPVDV
jgi:hypothetical protein